MKRIRRKRRRKSYACAAGAPAAVVPEDRLNEGQEAVGPIRHAAVPTNDLMDEVEGDVAAVGITVDPAAASARSGERPAAAATAAEFQALEGAQGGLIEEGDATEAGRQGVPMPFEAEEGGGQEVGSAQAAGTAKGADQAVDKAGTSQNCGRLLKRYVSVEITSIYATLCSPVFLSSVQG